MNAIRWNILLISGMAIFLICFLVKYANLPGEVIAGLATAVLTILATIAKELASTDPPSPAEMVAKALGGAPVHMGGDYGAEVAAVKNCESSQEKKEGA